jgi:hypothetical protein
MTSPVVKQEDLQGVIGENAKIEPPMVIGLLYFACDFAKSDLHIHFHTADSNCCRSVNSQWIWLKLKFCILLYVTLVPIT